MYRFEDGDVMMEMADSGDNDLSREISHPAPRQVKRIRRMVTDLTI
ncbi:MAG: hypothetical protein IPN36_16330 [Bacteroidetes bacterium]|nr:hypothetical protein [Bacteroidota bacterium]